VGTRLEPAAGNADHVAEFLVPHFLKVKGSAVDLITVVGDLMCHKALSYSQMLETALEARNLGEEPNGKYKGGGLWGVAFWRTLCTDVIRLRELEGNDENTIRRARSEDGDLFELWTGVSSGTRKYVRMYDNNKRSYFMFEESVYTAIQNRKFFVTREGYLGLGPREMQVGDEVYVLHGSNVPFVLRPKSRPPIDESYNPPYPIFSLVGACYLHGIMDGEACESQGGNKAISLVLD
jgi:hypothetical protein